MDPVCDPVVAPSNIAQTLVTPATAVVVPPEFTGTHYEATDFLGNPLVAPQYDYGYIRTLKAAINANEEVGFWSNIETSPGVYDFSQMDQWMALSGNRPVIWTIYGTPSFYQKYPNEPSLWNWVGIQSPPADVHLDKLEMFVAAVKAQYPNRDIKFELWNEPTLPWNGTSTDYNDRWTPQWGAANAPWEPRPFYSGTASDFANMLWALSAHDVMPAGFVAAWESDQHTITRISNAPVTATGGSGKGSDYFEDISVHYYSYNHDPKEVLAQIAGYRSKVPVGTKIYVTEIGGFGSGAFNANDPRAVTEGARWFLLMAALGMQSAIVYAQISNPEATAALSDAPNNPAVQQMLTLMYSLRGQTITNAWCLTDGSVVVTTADCDRFQDATLTTFVADTTPPTPPTPTTTMDLTVDSNGNIAVPSPGICFAGTPEEGLTVQEAAQFTVTPSGVTLTPVWTGDCVTGFAAAGCQEDVTYSVKVDFNGDCDPQADSRYFSFTCEEDDIEPPTPPMPPMPNCTAITGISIDPNPLLIDAGDTGIIKITLTGGNNDGTDIIAKQWNMPNWMNDGDVEWNATDGYHIPYGVPGTYWEDKDVEKIDMSVEYTASNDCTNAPPTENLLITIEDQQGGGGVIITGDCNECVYPSNTLTTQAQYVADMIGNGGGNHDESPIQSLNTALKQMNGRFNGSFYTQSGLANISTVPPDAILGQPIIFDHGIAWYVIYAQDGHQPGLNYGVMMSPLEVWFWLKSANGWVRQRRSNWQIKFSDLYVSPWNAADSNSFGAAAGSVGDCKSTKFDPTFWNLSLEQQTPPITRQGIMGHGYSNHDNINASDLCGVMVRTWAWLACFDPNGPNDIASAKYQLGMGYDFKSYNNGANLRWLPAAGGARQKTVTATPQLFTFTTQIGAREVLDYGNNEGSNECYMRPLSETFDSTFPFVFE